MQALRRIRSPLRTKPEDILAWLKLWDASNAGLRAFARRSSARGDEAAAMTETRPINREP